MNREWRRNTGLQRSVAGLLVILVTFAALLIAGLAGVRSVPLWLAIVSAVVAAAAMFLLCWGLEDVR